MITQNMGSNQALGEALQTVSVIRQVCLLQSRVDLSMRDINVKAKVENACPLCMRNDRHRRRERAIAPCASVLNVPHAVQNEHSFSGTS